MPSNRPTSRDLPGDNAWEGTPSSGALAYLGSQFNRHLRASLRRPGELLNPLVFFLMVVTLFPLGLGPAPEQLSAMAPGILWVVALLANLTVSGRLFVADFEDGSLEQMLLARHSLALTAMAEVMVHWLLSGVTLALVSPLFAAMLNLPSAGIPVLMVSLLLGSLCLSLIGAIAAALTVSLRRGGLLMSLLIIPLNVPILIFGVAAVSEAANGYNASAWLALLGAFACGGLVLAPLAIGAGLRISMDT